MKDIDHFGSLSFTQIADQYNGRSLLSLCSLRQDLVYARFLCKSTIVGFVARRVNLIS